MSDLINSITVVFDKDIKDVYCDKLIQAISLFEGVVNIEKNVTDTANFVAESRVRRELGEKLIDILYPKKK